MTNTPETTEAAIGPSVGSCAIMEGTETSIIISQVPDEQPYVGEGLWQVFDQYDELHIVEKADDGSWAVIIVDLTAGEALDRMERNAIVTAVGEGAAATTVPEGLPDAVRTVGLTINVPQYFQRPDFMAWLNDPARQIFTYHRQGEPVAHEYSDVIVLVDSHGEGDSSDMPEDIWEQICKTAYHVYGGEDAPSRLGSHIAVRLTNLEG